MVGIMKNAGAILGALIATGAVEPHSEKPDMPVGLPLGKLPPGMRYKTYKPTYEERKAARKPDAERQTKAEEKRARRAARNLAIAERNNGKA